MEDTLKHFAKLARDLQLNASTLPEASEQQVRDFAALVLQELTALGLLPDAEVGCFTHYAGKGGDA